MNKNPVNLQRGKSKKRRRKWGAEEARKIPKRAWGIKWHEEKYGMF